jgi:hypothetical protein
MDPGRNETIQHKNEDRDEDIKGISLYTVSKIFLRLRHYQMATRIITSSLEVN